jgi:3'(2'),5'-bisphosphate nucleotidase
MTLTTESLQSLCSIARDAGAAIMSQYGTGVDVKAKYDNSPVTQADLISDTIIRQGLSRLFPSLDILSEESSQPKVALTETYFLVDPLDGTREFIEGSIEFTVNIAMIRAERPVAGVVYLPATRRLYYAVDGLGAWTEDGQKPTPLKAREIKVESPLRITGSRKHGVDALSKWMASLSISSVFRPSGSSLKFCLIAEGSADIYPRLTPTYPWDTAAGQCVLECAGGKVTDWQGHLLRYPRGPVKPNPYFIATGPRNSVTSLLLSMPPTSNNPYAGQQAS